MDFVRVLIMAARDVKNPRRAGGDVTMWEVARRLMLRGDEVRLVASRFPGAPKVQNCEGITVYRPGGLYTAAPMAMLAYLRKWHQWSDVIVEEALGGLRLPYAAPVYARVPVVSFWYQDHMHIFRFQFGRLAAHGLHSLERLLAVLHRNAFILTCSNMSKAALVRMGLPPERISVYYPGAPASLIEFSKQLTHQSREPLVVAISKFRRYKCLQHAIEAFSKIKDSVRDSRLVLAGRREDTHYEHQLIRLAARRGLNDAVSLEFDITEQRKAELLRTARALVIPSPTEGFGLTGIEANLFGTPVVASTGVAPEVVENGVTGLSVPFGDIEAMAQGLRLLLTDDETFRRMSNAARIHARFFTWENAMYTIQGAIGRAMGES